MKTKSGGYGQGTLTVKREPSGGKPGRYWLRWGSGKDQRAETVDAMNLTEARRMLAERVGAHRAMQGRAPASGAVGDTLGALLDAWLANGKGTKGEGKGKQWSPDTRETNTARVRRMPEHWKATKLADLTPSLLGSWYRELERHPSIGPASTMAAHKAISAAINHGAREGWDVNTDVTKHASIYVSEGDRVEEIPDDDLAKIKAAVLACTDRNFATYVMLGAGTGCRKAEALGLDWKSVDLDAKTIWIRAKRTAPGGIQPGTKTSRGYRIIPVPDWLADYLKALPGDHTGLVVGLTPSDAGQRWVKWVQQDWGFRYHYHQMRHSFGSWLIRPKADGGAGLSMADAARHLGEDLLTFAKRYAHHQRDFQPLGAGPAW